MVSLDYLVSQKLGYKSALLAMLWFTASFASQHLPTYWMLPWMSHNYVAYRSCWEVIDLDLYFSLIYLLKQLPPGTRGSTFTLWFCHNCCLIKIWSWIPYPLLSPFPVSFMHWGRLLFVTLMTIRSPDL